MCFAIGLVSIKEITLNSDLDSFALEENQASDLPELLAWEIMT